MPKAAAIAVDIAVFITCFSRFVSRDVFAL